MAGMLGRRDLKFRVPSGTAPQVYHARQHRISTGVVEADVGSLILALSLAAGAVAQAHPPSSCTPATEAQTTHWGHQHVVLDFRDEPVTVVKGSVRDLDEGPVEGALVEVFARRRHDPLPQQSDRKETKPRISACLTGTGGSFEFRLPPGRYEVRVSRPDWNSTSALVVVDPKHGKRKPLTIRLFVGT